MRINARLEGKYEEMIGYLCKETHKNITEVIKNALDLYHARVVRQAKVNNASILKSGFVGSVSADADTSVNYKKKLFE